MTGSNKYYMLVASLPHVPASFEVEHVPISRRRLEERLKMLRPDDQEVVRQVQEFLLWDRQRRDRTDDEVKQHYDRLMQDTTNPLVRKIITYRMDVRTIMSGLRRRRLGMPPPVAAGSVGEHIAKHWQHPEFNLGREHPWIKRVSGYLETGDVLQVERQLLTTTWSRWSKLAERYHFRFENVILYLVRWEIVDRWTSLNPTLGRERFDGLLADVLRGTDVTQPIQARSTSE